MTRILLVLLLMTSSAAASDLKRLCEPYQNSDKIALLRVLRPAETEEAKKAIVENEEKFVAEWKNLTKEQKEIFCGLVQ